MANNGFVVIPEDDSPVAKLLDWPVMKEPVGVTAGVVVPPRPDAPLEKTLVMDDKFMVSAMRWKLSWSRLEEGEREEMANDGHGMVS